ncbi:Phage P2 baseplate assembly protein gpV [Hartmannibacter diazotrophicus]|uniref:Phage P2 baseplate assembly protein gpV n=1 Tax=Hartmannibacter diazotrophicus TaxID=1482074 RepID=A0A2C9D693_9HYPH|nr:phage baseplate protein [Hartmannibacter diazotrophicus]SON55816.1 Phage P2 baseplate assembly protein gpV [Hartmannibacter diazotrophicus]
MNAVATELRRLRRLAAVTDRRIALANLPGKVAAIDAENRLARLVIDTDEDGNPVLGPWATWEEPGVGVLAMHTPLKVGQQAAYSSPSGTLGAGSSIRPRAHDDDNPAPSTSADTVTFQVGASWITLNDGEVQISGDTIRLIGNVEVHGASLTHNGKNVGDSHAHSNVVNGPAISGPPV